MYTNRTLCCYDAPTLERIQMALISQKRLLHVPRRYRTAFDLCSWPESVVGEPRRTERPARIARAFVQNLIIAAAALAAPSRIEVVRLFADCGKSFLHDLPFE
jgi:hypothetical protein